MVGFSRLSVLLATIFAIFGSQAVAEETDFLYSNARICSRHKASFCLSYDDRRDMVVLSKGHRLRFEIETIKGVNMDINRVYTYAEDKATRSKVKSCLVAKEGSDDLRALTLAPCDTDDKELVLAVSLPKAKPVNPTHLGADDFVLRELSSFQKSERSNVADGLCLTLTYEENGKILPVNTKKMLHSGSFVALSKCANINDSTSEYGQELRATHYKKQLSSRAHLDQAVTESQTHIGRFCLTEKPDLCLGISLTNGVALENNKFIQIKNYTKNKLKNLHDLKMEWFVDETNNRIATAAQMDYCLEAVYGAPMGKNRRGIDFFDDILHLGSCDPNRVIVGSDAELFEGLPISESFTTKIVNNRIGTYMELRTQVPVDARTASDAGTMTTTKCASVVRCVRHEKSHCTKYNSNAIYDVAEIEQGAHVRLKDCDSENMPSQRFYYTRSVELTTPPTRHPTPEPETPTKNPTGYPTAAPTPYPTEKLPSPPAPVPPPTASPVASEPQIPPTASEDASDDEQSENDVPEVTKTANSGLVAGLLTVGVVCLAIIVIAAGYYYHNRTDFQQVNEEDENFIARV